MSNEFINFEKISRESWKMLHQKTKPLLTQEELKSITSLNDNINITDVVDVYLPLINLIQIYKIAQENLSFSKSLFLKKDIQLRPFIIGISGSVAVGKSTTSRLLQLLLSRTHPNSRVELVTTDGFLYPNQVLIERGIFNRKGFPESYNMELLLNFLDTIKSGQSATIPLYSHDIYDIVPDQEQTVDSPDFLIVEGINVFQNQQNNRLYMNDYFDFSIYIDADSAHIEHWYIERFLSILNMAKQDSNSYYAQYTTLPQDEAVAFARNVWKTVNLENLEKFIEPTRNRAELILHKAADHKIDEIYLKK
ncbi:type I pantothenate kinase [Streptococcus dysgalactiae subsp. dysgalactiae]|uniref:Pantothenate kinase n=1 Tax=Streptococcus dysgalactiae TaxID=1334 RepID=A0ABU0A9X1_STRDY|nr:type I pantothenate kinase [Streptococcus dysgalactiae]ADX24648.1 pantothenate kinase [Streptococcus dysgalactiae subsp. equisimilis ATCC 12394]EGL47340.1 pantothenate kinase [Streptococcus dysgalactiae subsp. equisimilis SK1249]EGR89060.1 pantothenate kinase [Streptococcus dysgalactiae subsp. equisimilis SK1250]KKC22518.1 pantothenate kinase [Streptococcus dysgalactiae subsp. equisimilis]MBM6513767.1 type I pantothenate kinase [Streptococcus dysgalactiae subsp. equisimilis]